jgi:superfamily II DNA or RNA helicase
VRGKLALILVALVVLPAIVFVVARDHQARQHARAGIVVTETGTVKTYVATWLAHHPGASCTITAPNRASCTQANGSATDIVMGSTDIVVSP